MCSAVISLGAAAGSMVYLAQQTKAATEQAKIGNAMAGVTANDSVLGALREVHLLMLERPGIRRYFYGDQPCGVQDESRDDVVTIAELLADVMNIGIVTHKQVPDSESAAPWRHYCESTLRSSPVLRELIREHPLWWPDLVPLGDGLNGQQPPPEPDPGLLHPTVSGSE
ncbi:hypothetical protein ACFYR1_47365 [Streptomyces canus]|uniref:hypothetical protein n=1 Tax=Streptomyces canus TaxID=58343 RepID=UPI003688A484